MHKSDNSLLKPAFLLCFALAEFAFAPEYISLIPALAVHARVRGDIGRIAARVVVRLAEYDECLEELCDNRMEAFFRMNINDPSVRQSARKFLSIVGD
jgi:hypothetical protein